MGTAAPDRPAPRGAGFVSATLTLVGIVAVMVFAATDGVYIDRPWLVLFLGAAAVAAVWQVVDLGLETQFDGAQPITVLAGMLGGPLGGAAVGAISALFYGRRGGSKFTYGSVRALQGMAAAALVKLPEYPYDSTGSALVAGIRAEAAAGAVMLAATAGLALLQLETFDRALATWNVVAVLLAAPFVGGLALADARAGAGPLVLVLVPTLLAIGAARAFRERWQTKHEESEARANHDPLTGAYNRRWFDDALRLEPAGQDGTGLVLLDLDHFKRVNDVHGHAAGDAVLVETVRRLTAGVRPGDAVVRWGGEEFAILLRRLGSGTDLAARAEELRASISERPFVVEGVAITVTASAGAATLVGDADSLVRSADAALYDAKRSGRNRAVLV